MAKHNRLFIFLTLLLVAGIALIWTFFLPEEGASSQDDVPASEIRLSDGRQKMSLNKGMQVLPDPGGSLSYAQVQASPMKERFIPASGRSAFGLDGNTYWIRVTMTNESSSDRWVLRLSNAIVDTVQLYVNDQPLQADDRFSVGSELKDHYWAYELILPLHRPVTIHLRATTEGSMILPLEMMSPSAYHGKLMKEYLLFGLYYGFVLLMAAYMCVLYIFMKDSSYLYYSLYIIFFALSQLFWNGLPQEILGEHHALVRLLLRILDSYEGIFLFFFIVCLWFALFFLDKVLQLNVYVPRLRRIARIIQAVSPLVLLALLFHWPGFSTIAIWYEAFIFAFLNVAIFLSVIRGNITARYYGLGMLAIIGSIAPAVLYTFSVTDYSLLTHYGYQLGSVTEFLVFATLLSYQSRQVLWEKVSAQRLMIANQEKLVHTLEDWNEKLEKTVSERTEKLVLAQRRRSELLQNISHDIRSPLTVVQGGIRAMMLGIQVLPGEQNKHLETLYEKVRYITRFIDDLFKLSLAEQEEQSQNNQPEDKLSVKQWIEQEFDFLEEYVRIAGLQCESEIRAEGDAIVAIDPHGMRRALSNLVHNACKYSPANTRVRLAAAIDSDGIRICVEDEGQGIGAEHLDGIFARANRGSQVDPETGKGFGLAIVKEIVEQHGGTITVSSVMGKGSRFVVSLPADQSFTP